MSNFDYCLQQAHEDEKLLCTVLEQYGFTNATLNESDEYETLKGYDVTFEKDGVTYTGELKTDYQYSQTGNVAVEYEYRNRPSGIFSTTADLWFYKLGDEYYVVSPKKIKEYVATHRRSLRFVCGGDDGASKLVLIPIEQFKSITRKTLTS